MLFIYLTSGNDWIWFGSYSFAQTWNSTSCTWVSWYIHNLLLLLFLFAQKNFLFLNHFIKISCFIPFLIIRAVLKVAFLTSVPVVLVVWRRCVVMVMAVVRSGGGFAYLSVTNLYFYNTGLGAVWMTYKYSYYLYPRGLPSKKSR